MNKKISAADLRKGECAVIKKILGKEETARKLRDIGFSEQTKIKCAGSGLFKDPAAYIVKGAVIALRNNDAKLILCEKTAEDNDVWGK